MIQMRNVLLGAFGALALAAVAACGGANPSASYPAVKNLGSASALTTSGVSITIPAESGLAVGTAKVAGSGSVSVTQSTSAASGVPVLSAKTRAKSVRVDDTANTPVAYVTVTAESSASLSQVQLAVAPTSSVPSGTYYVAFWNGTQWVTVGSPATVTNGVISVNTGALNPPVTLASGSSYYLAIYAGQIFTTPTPPPPSPAPSPSAVTLFLGASAQIQVASGEGITIKASSSNSSLVAVTPASAQTALTNGSYVATFTVTASATQTGTATITFTDPLGHTGTTKVTVSNAPVTPSPNPGAPAIGLGDAAVATVHAKPGVSISITTGSSSVATVAAGASGTPPPSPTQPSAGSFGASASVTTDGSGNAYFWVEGVAGGYTTISLNDATDSLTGTMDVTVSAISNGTFTNGTTGWTPCSYAYTAKSAPVNPASPVPNTPEPAQTAAAETPVPLASLSPLVNVTAPPANDNPGWSDYTSTSVTPNTGSVTFMQNGTSETVVTPGSAPSVLGSDVMLIGSIEADTNPYPKGNFGVCQTIAIPTAPPSESGPYLSMYVLEGGSEYSFKYADNEAALFGSYSSNVASSLDEYLFTEENCYLHPTTASPAGIWAGSGVNATSGCWPQTYGGDSSNYYNWLMGGFWQERGPYDLSAYAGTTVTLFLGNWSYYHDSSSYYAQFMYVGNVETTFSSTFPTSAPLNKKRGFSVTVSTPRAGIKVQKAVKPVIR